MPRYTSAYSSFVDRLAEVRTLRVAAARKEKENPVRNREQINAICRGSIVLLSSHVEAYVRELGEVALESIVLKAVTRDKFPPRLFYHISKDIIGEIFETNDPDKVSMKVFDFLNRDINFWSQTGHFPTPIPVARFSKGFANPAHEKIRAYLARFGYDGYRNDLNRELRAQAVPVINVLNHLVDTRNSIAHGDPSATKTPSEIQNMIKTVKIYCRVTDDVFSRWCKGKYCSIR